MPSGASPSLTPSVAQLYMYIRIVVNLLVLASHLPPCTALRLYLGGKCRGRAADGLALLLQGQQEASCSCQVQLHGAGCQAGAGSALQQHCRSFLVSMQAVPSRSSGIWARVPATSLGLKSGEQPPEVVAQGQDSCGQARACSVCHQQLQGVVPTSTCK